MGDVVKLRNVVELDAFLASVRDRNAYQQLKNLIVERVPEPLQKMTNDEIDLLCTWVADEVWKFSGGNT